MPTGYTQQIIDGTVKTTKEFLHLCLRNFGVCISMRDMPFDSQGDYTEYIKKFALDQIDISKDDEDYYADELSKEMLTKEEFISEGKYKEELLKNSKWDIDYHQKELDYVIKNMNDTLAFYEHFKKEIEKL